LRILKIKQILCPVPTTSRWGIASKIWICWFSPRYEPANSHPRYEPADSGTKYRGCFFGISMATGHTKHIACPQPRGEPTGYSNIALQ